MYGKHLAHSSPGTSVRKSVPAWRRRRKLRCLGERTGCLVQETDGLGRATKSSPKTRERVIWAIVQPLLVSLTHKRYNSRGLEGAAADKRIIPQFLNSNFCVRGGTKLLTRVHSIIDKKVNSKAKLHGGKCIQESCDQFVLQRYRVSSEMARMSRRIRINDER